MKQIWNDISRSRLYLYIIHALPYMAYWKVIGFEFSIIMCASTILGEIHYQNKQRNGIN